MFKRCIHIALAILAALGTTLPGALLPFAARASAPNTLSYQGRLRDEGGIVVADGDYSFSFTLWDDLNAGTADWTENQTVAVTDGYFSVQLGTIDPFQDGAGQETDFSQPLFLEVVVEAETLTPRVTINSVAYALSSRAAESYASEAAAEAASEPYGGRMYYNTTSGHLYVYDAIGLSWEDTTAAGTIDSAYGAFGSDPAVVTVDNLEGQGDLAFLLDGADLLVQDGGGTFVTFADDGTTTFASTVGFNGQLALGDNGDTVAINSSDWDVSATGDMTGIGSLAMNGNLTQTGVTDFSTGTGTVSLNGATTVANGNAFTANGQLALGDNGDTVAIDSSDWDIDVTGAITGVSFDANGTGNSISNIESVDISDATITGDDLASSIAGTGLALTAGSPDVLDVGAGNGIAVAADSVAVALLAVADGTGTVSSDSGLEFQGAGNDKLTLLQGCTADQILKWNDGASTWGCADDDSTPGGIPTLDDVYQQGGTVNVSAYDVLFDLSDDTNDYKFVIDNNSTGAIATAFSITSNGLGSSVGTAVDLSDADIATALALGSNDVTVGGATISSSELALLDSGVALSELADSGTLTAGTVDINGGNIDGTAVGATAASSGAFTTLDATGALSLGDGSSTADINSAGWHINTAGDMFGIGQINANGLVSLSAGLTVSAGNISLTDDTGTAWSINNNGAAILESVTVGGDAVNDFTGTGLAMSGNSLTASLGTAVDASEITDNTITLADVAASLTFDSDLTFVSDSATNDYHLILDNSSAGDVASFLVVTTSGEGGTVGTAVDLSDADIATALALGSNDVTVGGATISSSELALLDSGVALSELADSGTLTAGTVDINGGNIDGTAVGATAASSGAFTTLSSTGVTTLGNGSATVAIDSSDWDIDATGAMTGIANITSDDNEPAFPINLTVSGTGSSTHTLALQVDGNAGITIAATETGGAGAVGARTVQVGVSADADIVTLGDANADVSLTDAQWSIASNGGGALVSMTLSGAAGLDSSGATTLAIGNTNASAISLCNSATCDSIMIGDNADADTITIGDASNDTTTLNGSTVAIDSGDWDITTTGAMTGIGAITMDGNFSQTGATTFSTGTGTVSLNGATTVANGNTFTANGQVALGDNGDTVAVNSSDWDIDATGAMTGIASIVGNDNQTDLFLNQNVTGTDSGVHNVAFQIDGTPALVLSATGDGAGGVGAKTVNVAVTPGADTVNIGDSDTNVAITDANWTISGAGAAGFDGDITLSSGGGSLITTGGGLTLGDNSQTVFVNSSDWDISTTGAMTGIASFAGDDNQNNLFTNLNVTGADALVHTIALQIDGNTGISVAATGDAAGGVGARTVQVGVSAGADVITVGDSDADVSIIDANWNIQSVGNAQFQRVRVTDATAAGGIDMGGAATLNIANTNASAVSLCNSAACDTIQIGTNADADTIQIGDNSDTFSMDTSNFDVSSGDLTLGGGDLIGLTSTSIDLGEQISGAISFFSGSSNIIFNGDADTSVLFNSTTDATESDITTTVGQDLRVSPGGVGDIVLVTDADTQVTLPGSADGVNNLVLTTGNLLVSDGDLTLSGGDFDVTMDAGDSVSVTNTGATTSSGAFVINQTTAAANLGNSAGLGVNATFVDYADDGGSDNRQGIVVSVTNNASDLGIDDNIFGVRVQNLGGVNQADGGEYAIATGSGWDVDWLLGNGETISNQTDNTIAFSGNAGNKATLTFDLNGASATNVPAMSGGASDLVTVNDSLSVGIDGDTTENIGVSGFAITGGDDLYVNDDVGINGDVYIDGLFSVGNEVSLTANSTTPSVAGGTQFLINNSAGTVITNFTNGQQGQMVFIRVVDNNTSLDCTASSIQCGSTDITLGTGDGLLLYKQDPGTWQLVSLMDNSDNHNAGNGFDYAEWFPSREALVPGEVVSVDSTGIEYVKASTGAYDRTVVGVVSTQPGMTIGEPTSAHAAQIALAGRVPVNVTDENGPIVPGDYLTASSTPGYAMKATEAGPVIAIAMDAFDGDSGQVGSKIANFWYTPPTSVASGLQGSDGSALAAGALGADTLVVSGDAVFQGSVTVEDHVNVGQDVAGRARIISGDTRVHVAFENPYVSEPIVTATLRTATDIPGYWWVEEESTTGFDLVLDGTLAYDVEFNWIALGVNDGVVSVSDGSTREINVYVVDGSVPPPAANVGSSDAVGGSDDAGIAPESPTEDVPADEPSDTLSEPDVTEEPTPVDAPVEAPVDEPVVDAPVADEPAPTVEEPVVTEPVADPSV